MEKDLLRKHYEHRKNYYLDPLVTPLGEYLCDRFATYPRIDNINVRVKDINRFIEKSLKINENGLNKYNDPLNEIQDQIGARIITYYLSDVDQISEIVESYFKHIERTKIIPDSIKEFGYEGKHYILFLPEDIIPDTEHKKRIIPFFELQIKTLFQHAWSEAEHDLDRKSTRLNSSHYS